MRTTRTIAGLYGPMLVVITVTEMLSPRTWDSTIPAVTYLSGMVWFIIGLAVVRYHNRWVRSWPVVVTIMGWFAVVLGTMRMLAPIGAQQGTAQSGAVVAAVQLLLLLAGAVMTYRAYAPGARESDPDLESGLAAEGSVP